MFIRFSSTIVSPGRRVAKNSFTRIRSQFSLNRFNLPDNFLRCLFADFVPADCNRAISEKNFLSRSCNSLLPKNLLLEDTKGCFIPLFIPIIFPVLLYLTRGIQIIRRLMNYFVLTITGQK